MILLLWPQAPRQAYAPPFPNRTSQGRERPASPASRLAKTHLFLVLLLFLDQLSFELCLYLSEMASLLQQHLLHVNTAGLALLQAAFKLAHLDFGGDQLKG